VKTAWDRRWKQVKLYFMIGLPGETDADVLGIAETVQVRSRSVTAVVVSLMVDSVKRREASPMQGVCALETLDCF
jgi:radical SAM superfamily enzyme YgiQ (UPF0313 family)